MAFAITKVQAYGQEAEEPVNKRYRQFMMLTLTAANTDVDLDLGDNQAGSLGTFWDAVDGTTIGANSLKAIQDIVTRAEAFASIGGNFMDRAQADSSASSIIAYDATPQAPGGTTATYVVTGLLATDTVISVLPTNGTSPIEELTSIANNQAVVEYVADPGAAASVRVTVQRAGVTGVVAGTYQVSYANKTPNILFASGDAPTSYQVTLEWVLQPGTPPVEYYATA
jgi:hypothetical protein